jgi:hypothetical protein
MKVPYVYEWAKIRGFFGRKGRVSHLLLDGGVLGVPDDCAGEFMGAYALGVVKPGRPKPCVVETKTPVFRMFYDLDAHVAGEAAWGAYDDVLRIVCETTAACFEGASADAVVCATNKPKELDGGLTKFGIHVTFDGIFATRETALVARERVLAALADAPSPFANDWASVVDVAVFKGSGMRLPWSVKKGEDDRWYVPVAEYVGGAWKPLERPETSVSSARSLLARSSLRYFGPPTPCAPDVVAACETAGSTVSPRSLTHASLREHAEAARLVELAVSAKYPGNVTGVLVGTHAVIFRHDSRFCANVNREHTSSNTYFLLTTKGLQQCCYSRKDVSPGGEVSCGEFKGEFIDVPSALTYRYFPPSCPPPMPSVGSKTDLDALMSRTRGKTKKRATAVAAPRKSSPLNKLLGIL